MQSKSYNPLRNFTRRRQASCCCQRHIDWGALWNDITVERNALTLRLCINAEYNIDIVELTTRMRQCEINQRRDAWVRFFTQLLHFIILDQYVLFYNHRVHLFAIIRFCIVDNELAAMFSYSGTVLSMQCLWRWSEYDYFKIHRFRKSRKTIWLARSEEECESINSLDRRRKKKNRDRIKMNVRKMAESAESVCIITPSTSLSLPLSLSVLPSLPVSRSISAFASSREENALQCRRIVQQ